MQYCASSAFLTPHLVWSISMISSLIKLELSSLLTRSKCLFKKPWVNYTGLVESAIDLIKLLMSTLILFLAYFETQSYVLSTYKDLRYCTILTSAGCKTWTWMFSWVKLKHPKRTLAMEKKVVMICSMMPEGSISVFFSITASHYIRLAAFAILAETASVIINENLSIMPYIWLSRPFIRSFSSFSTIFLMLKPFGLPVWSIKCSFILDTKWSLVKIMQFKLRPRCLADNFLPWAMAPWSKT